VKCEPGAPVVNGPALTKRNLVETEEWPRWLAAAYHGLGAGTGVLSRPRGNCERRRLIGPTEAASCHGDRSSGAVLDCRDELNHNGCRSAGRDRSRFLAVSAS
jgi:hypothetical protein